MRKIICIFMATFTFVGFLCGCQATPEEPIVIGKTQEIEEKIEEADPSEKPVAETVPEGDWVYEKTYDSGNKLTVNAMVYPGETEEIPVLKVKQKPFEGGDSLREIIERLYPGYHVVEPTGAYTVEEIMNRLNGFESLRKSLELNQDTSSMASVDRQINELKRELEKAVPETELPETDYQLEDIPGGGSRQLNVKAVKEGESGVSISFANFDKDYAYDSSMHIDVLDEKVDTGSDFIRAGVRQFENDEDFLACKKAADAYLAKLGIDYMAADYVRKSEKLNGYYEITYVREINGRRENDAVYNWTDFSQVENVEYAPKWNAESLTLRVYQDKVLAVRWHSPGQTELHTENVKIISWEDAQAIFKKIMDIKLTPKNTLTQNPNEPPKPHDVTVTRAELGYTKLVVKDSDQEYMLIPTWNFFGTDKVDEFSSKTETCFITINAIDGTIVDRGMLY